MYEITEEQEDHFRSEERNRQRELIEKIRQNAQKHYDHNEENYQSAGSPGSYRAMNKWQDLLDLCSIAQQSLDTECWRCQQRYRNGKQIAQQLKERQAVGVTQIDIDEAIELIMDIAS